MYASTMNTMPSYQSNSDLLGMLPRPESPVPSSSSPVPFHHRHRQTASVSSGPHPPSPLAQAPLVPDTDVKGKSKLV